MLDVEIALSPTHASTCCSDPRSMHLSILKDSLDFRTGWLSGSQALQRHRTVTSPHGRTDPIDGSLLRSEVGK